MNYDIKIREDDKDKEMKQDIISIERQIEMELKSGKSKNPLKELTGKWPGDETLDDLLKQLEE